MQTMTSTIVAKTTTRNIINRVEERIGMLMGGSSDDGGTGGERVEFTIINISSLGMGEGRRRVG